MSGHRYLLAIGQGVNRRRYIHALDDAFGVAHGVPPYRHISSRRFILAFAGPMINPGIRETSMSRRYPGSVALGGGVFGGVQW